MTELEYAITSTLRADAQEAAMTTNTARESQKLDARLDALDRSHRRRTWALVAAAAAAVVVAVVGVRALGGQSSGEVIAPVPQVGKSYSTSSFVIPFTVTLPAWTNGIAPPARDETDRKVYWEQSECTKNGSPVACLDGSDLKLRFFSPVNLYRPQDGPASSPVPDYKGYVAYLTAIGATGDVIVSDLSTTTVDGRPATVMTLAPQAARYGALGCESPFDAARDCFGLVEDDKSHVFLRFAVVDAGGATPLLTWTRVNRDNPQASQAMAQFDTMLTTLSITGVPKPSAS